MNKIILMFFFPIIVFAGISSTNSSNTNIVYPISILNGGTGQTTANSGLNALLPSQPGNNGKALFTDGTNTFWNAVSGSGTLTNITAIDNSIDIINPTTTPDLSIHFPMNAALGTNLLPSIRFDSDTGMYSTGDGMLAFSTNAVKQLELAVGINPNIFTNSVSAPDFIYPSKSSNLFLSGPVTGSAIPNFRTIQFGDISSAALPSPIVLGVGGGLGSDGIQWDSDTAILSPGDGHIKIYANNVPTVDIQPGVVEIDSTLNVIGNISAANYPPTGTANRITYFNGSGNISSSEYLLDSNQWLGAYLPKDVSADANNYTGNALELPIESTADFTHSILGINLDEHFDRNNTGANFSGSLRGVSYSVRSEGSGNINEIRGGDIYAQAGNGNAGSVDSLNGFGVYPTIATGTTAVSLNGFELNSSGGGSISGNANLFNLYNSNNIDGYYNVINGNQSGNVGLSMNYIAFGMNGNVSGNYTWFNLSNNGTADSFNLLNVTQNNTITNNYQGINQQINADVGNGNDVINFYTANINSGNSIGANVNVISFSNASPLTGNNGINGIDINNQSAGTANRYNAYNSYNSANITEEIGGFRHNSTGDARTGYGFDTNISGNYTDDVRGMRINLSATSTNSDINGFELDVSGSTAPSGHVVNALSINGGKNQINGQYNPESGLGFVIGNYLGMTSTVNSTLTGDEFLQQIIQSSLILNSSVSAGPYGLGLTGIAAVNQLDIDSAVTQDFYRAVLLGASNPSGSGTLNNYVGLEVLGFPSFGGGITVNNKVGIRDFNGLGQTFCNGVSDCWMYQAIDSNAHNWFAGDLVLGGTTGLPTGSYKLDIDGNMYINGSIKSTGGLQLSTSATQPTCDASNRGLTWNIEGGTGVADIFQVCQKDSSDIYSWVTH